MALLISPLPGLQEQEKKSRVKGIEAVKSNIQAAKAVSRVLRTSLGPKGMDKLLQGPDGDIVISECQGRAAGAGRPRAAPPAAACRPAEPTYAAVPRWVQRTMEPPSWSRWRLRTR